MRRLFQTVCCVVAGLSAGIAAATAQPAGCTAGPSAATAQTLRCGGVIIVAENGAQYTMLDRDGNGIVDGIELRSKTVLVDAPKQRAGTRFEVITPQAIAAVRGTKWAVDAQDGRTAVFVFGGQVDVRRRAGRSRVVLGPGEGVDVEQGAAAPLVVRRWPQPRVAGLLARLGQ